MKKYLFNLLILIFLLICQLLIGIIFPALNLIPDFILIYVVMRAIMFGAKDGMLFAATGGILQDVFLNSLIGIFTPVKTAIAFLASLLTGRFFQENLLIPPLAVFIATLIHEILYLLLKENYLFTTDYLLLFKQIILPMAILNTTITFISYLSYLLWQRWNLNGQT
ncbi:MAG: rod shape-determining protein MreD [Bacillota bacterium]